MNDLTLALMRDYVEDLPCWEIHCAPAVEDMVRKAIRKEGWTRLKVVVSPLVPPGQVIMFDTRYQESYPLPQDGI